MKKQFLGLISALLLIGMVTLVLNIHPVKAFTGTVYIRADGSVDPLDAPIQRNGDLYTLTDNINSDADGIIVQKDNVVIDGSGFTLRGTGVPLFSKGIDLSGRINVTIMNMGIEAFREGVWLYYSSKYNTIVGNNIKANFGRNIHLYHSSDYNSIIGNNITGGYWAGIPIPTDNILIADSSYNKIVGNSITGSGVAGIWVLDFSCYNIISGNGIKKNFRGIWLENLNAPPRYNSIVGNNITMNFNAGLLDECTADNLVYHNNFIDNNPQVNCYESTNIWDDGYPSGGNYWSDYKERYPNATEINGSGIWNAPYVIDKNNQDNYPLVEPWSPIEVPPVEDTEAYIDYVNETIQDLPDEIFNKPGEDILDVKYDFSDLFDNALENINEGNYEGAIEKLETIKEKIYQEMVESAERQEIISLVDDLIAYLETLL